MPKKCPSGVICFETMTLLVFISLFIGIIIYIQAMSSSSNQQSSSNVRPLIIQRQQGLFPRPSYSFSNLENDVLLNPYSAPLKNTQMGIPINIETRGIATAYRQVGILTRLHGPETILPLMGRPIQPRRDKWQYYTMTDKSNSIKLPVSVKGKSCTSEYGCDDILNGDTVYVEGYNDAFKATIYDSAYPRYIPYL